MLTSVEGAGEGRCHPAALTGGTVEGGRVGGGEGGVRGLEGRGWGGEDVFFLSLVAPSGSPTGDDLEKFK